MLLRKADEKEKKLLLTSELGQAEYRGSCNIDECRGEGEKGRGRKEGERGREGRDRGRGGGRDRGRMS